MNISTAKVSTLIRRPILLSNFVAIMLFHWSTRPISRTTSNLSCLYICVRLSCPHIFDYTPKATDDLRSVRRQDLLYPYSPLGALQAKSCHCIVASPPSQISELSITTSGRSEGPYRYPRLIPVHHVKQNQKHHTSKGDDPTDIGVNKQYIMNPSASDEKSHLLCLHSALCNDVDAPVQ